MHPAHSNPLSHCTTEMARTTLADLNAPMAPELGLFLDECYYESYSKQWGHQHGGDLALAPFAQDVEAFKVSGPGRERVCWHLKAWAGLGVTVFSEG